MTTDPKATPDEILRSEGAGKSVEGTYLQRTGLLLAGFVGGLGALVILFLVGKWIAYPPAVPVIPPGADQNAAKAILENYKTLQQLHWNRSPHYSTQSS